MLPAKNDMPRAKARTRDVGAHLTALPKAAGFIPGGTRRRPWHHAAHGRLLRELRREGAGRLAVEDGRCPALSADELLGIKPMKKGT
jgi:hypothetical protein